MTKDQIEAMSGDLAGYIINLRRAPTPTELSIFITKWLRARKNGSIMA